MSYIGTGDLLVETLGAVMEDGIAKGVLVIEVMEGVRGPAGPTGEPGVGASVLHTQITPSTSWVFAHNLDVQFPDIEVFIGGVKHFPAIESNLNVATISFPSAATGIAIARR